MGTVLLIAIGLIGIAVAIQWHKGTKSLNELTAQGKATVQSMKEARHTRIIEGGRRLHEERRKKHPILYGWIKYNSKQYLLDHMTDFKNYPMF